MRRIYQIKRGRGVEIASVAKRWKETGGGGGAGRGWGKWGEGHCFKWELSLDSKQSRMSAAMIS